MAGRNRDDDDVDHSSRYDAHRNDSDDPVLVDRLRRPPEPGAIVLGSSQPIGRTALPVGEYPVGGQVLSISNKPGLGTPQLTTLMQWSSPDGVARKGTVALACNVPALVTPFLAFGQAPAVYCLVTVGSARGKIAFWQVAPALVPVEATYVRVDAMLAPAGGLIGFLGGGGGDGQTAFAKPPPFTVAQVYTCNVQAQFFDNKAPGEWPTIQLGPSMQQASTATNLGLLYGYPAIVKSAVFNNNNATSAVWMVLADTYKTQGGGVGTPLNLSYAKLIVNVPAQASISIGEDLLGSFTNGVAAVGVTSPDGSQGRAWTEDNNDANVFVTLRGQQLSFAAS